LQPDRVKLVLPMVSLIPDEVDQALRVRFGDRFAKLDKTAVQAVVTAQVEGSVTNGRMQEITGRTLQRHHRRAANPGARWPADAAEPAALGELPRGGGLPPFSLRIFVADGDPDGLRIVDKSNWIGKALVFPRALLPQVKARPETGADRSSFHRLLVP
jgi:hypothetical protein